MLLNRLGLHSTFLECAHFFFCQRYFTWGIPALIPLQQFQSFDSQPQSLLQHLSYCQLSPPNCSVRVKPPLCMSYLHSSSVGPFFPAGIGIHQGCVWPTTSLRLQSSDLLAPLIARHTHTDSKAVRISPVKNDSTSQHPSASQCDVMAGAGTYRTALLEVAPLGTT